MLTVEFFCGRAAPRLSFVLPRLCACSLPALSALPDLPGPSWSVHGFLNTLHPLCCLVVHRHACTVACLGRSAGSRRGLSIRAATLLVSKLLCGPEHREQRSADGAVIVELGKKRV